MIQSLDAGFGRLRAALSSLGLEENTLFIFLSDNGPCSGSAPTDRFMAGLHGLKGTVYENGIRVPAIFSWPAGGVVGPSRSTAVPAAHIDVRPTVWEAAAPPNADGKPTATGPAPAGPPVDGRSILGELRNTAEGGTSESPPDRELFFQWDSGQEPRKGAAFCVIDGDWKLVQPCGMDAPEQQHIRDRYTELCRIQNRGDRSIEGEPRYELYNLSDDPGEKQDVAEEHPERVADLRHAYEQWFEEVSSED